MANHNATHQHSEGSKSRNMRVVGATTGVIILDVFEERIFEELEEFRLVLHAEKF